MHTNTYLDRLAEATKQESPKSEFRIPEKAVEEVAAKIEEIPTDNCIFAVAGQIAMEATDDKIIILLDPFRTGMECKKCNGSGIEPECVCKGTGVNRLGGICKECNGEPLRFVGRDCRTCKGVGASIIIPESAKSLPSSGRIVSCGPLVKTRKVGERYLFGVHTGYFLPFKGNIFLRCLRENEVLCRVYSLDTNVAMGDYFAVPDMSKIE